MAGSLTFLFQATHLIQNAFAVFRFFFSFAVWNSAV